MYENVGFFFEGLEDETRNDDALVPMAKLQESIHEPHPNTLPTGQELHTSLMGELELTDLCNYQFKQSLKPANKVKTV